MMCRPAHGNLFPLTDDFPKPDLRHLLMGASLATFNFLKAFCVVAATDEKAEFEAIGQQIIDVLRNSRDLWLDDLPDAEKD